MEKITPTEKIVIDGLEIETTSQAKQVIVKLQKEHDKLSARADAAEARVAALTKDSAELPAKVAAMVRERVALESHARQYVSDSFDGLPADDVRKLVLKKLAPALTTDGKSSDYIAALYDVTTQSVPKPAPQQTLPVADAHRVSTLQTLRQSAEDAYFGRTKEGK